MATTSTSTRAKKAATWASVPLALLVSSLTVWHASYSAFSATTNNPSSNWATGDVALRDDDSNTALFDAGNLKPGSTGTKCIVVTSSGSLASSVKLYGTGASTTRSLDSWIDLTVEEGAGGSFSNCTGFIATGTVFNGTLADFATNRTSFATGVGTWTPAGQTAPATVSRTYRFSYTVNSSTPNSAQGGTATIGFTWEAQSS